VRERGVWDWEEGVTVGLVCQLRHLDWENCVN
jgi:hypothetical protein